jgi:hypothetical protein
MAMGMTALHRRRCHPSIEDGLLDEGRLVEEEDGHL